jgi:hypothetical protein
MKPWFRVAYRLKAELALAALGALVGIHVALSPVPGLAALAALLAALGAAAGVSVLTRKGELALAWNCPRLDALGLRSDSRHLPWSTLRAAEAALGALEQEGGVYREFFPQARADLLRSACRVLDAHRLGRRAERALREAPPGVARQHLERQRLRADQEVLELTRVLCELRARFVASTAPLPSVEDPTPSLRALEQRTGALAQAIDEVRVGGHR